MQRSFHAQPLSLRGPWLSGNFHVSEAAASAQVAATKLEVVDMPALDWFWWCEEVGDPCCGWFLLPFSKTGLIFIHFPFTGMISAILFEVLLLIARLLHC